jgi:hypothetical protein
MGATQDFTFLSRLFYAAALQTGGEHRLWKASLIQWETLGDPVENVG